MGGLKRGLQLFGQIKLLPRHGRIAKVAVGRGAAVYGPAEIERAYYGLRPKVKAAAHGGKQLILVHRTRAERVYKYGYGLRHAYRVSQLQFAALGKARGNYILGNVARGIGCAAVNLGGVLAAEGSAAVGAKPP